MSFIDTITDAGSSVWDWIKGDSTSAALAKSAALGFALSELSGLVDNTNTASVNRITVNPSTDNFIPIIYGDTFAKGMITDARLTDNNLTMWYCITICEKTGTLLSTGIDSEITFKNVYWNQLEVKFQGDGVTVDKLADQDGLTNSDISGLVKIYLFNNGSTHPTGISGIGNSQPAYSIFPEWGPNHLMSNLVFALVKITYDKNKGITGLGDLEFKISNTLKQPGDVLYDYMTSTVYGAGIPVGDILL